MTYCRQGHTLFDLEAEAGWDSLVPGTFFELIVGVTTYYGIVDEYVPPTPDTLVCRLYDDPARTIFNTAAVATGVPFTLQNFVDYNWTPRDVELNSSKKIGTWTSPPVQVRDDFGIWTGSWTATPMTDEKVQFNFDGTYALFKATADNVAGVAVAGAGLAADTYTYCISPVDGGALLGADSPTITVILGAPGNIQLSWAANNQVASWNIYGRTAAGFGLIANVPGATTTFLDDGTLVPNPAMQPALFEDPGFTLAAPNKAISLSDDGITTDGFGNEIAVEKRDDGLVLSDAVGVGTLTVVSGGKNFDITGLESTANTAIGVVVDPGLFTNLAGPPSSSPPIVHTYDQHIFVNSMGYIEVVESDSTTGRITRVVYNTTSGFAEVTITDLSGMLITTGTIALTEMPPAPAVGSASTKITYSNFSTLTDGTIIGDKTIELNTYQVTPLSGGGGLNDLLLTNVTSGPGTTPRIIQSMDGGLTWPVDFDPESKFTFPLTYFSFGSLGNGHGEGWTVWCCRSVTNGNFCFMWTNDLSLGVWPFQDGSGRVINFSTDYNDWLFGFDTNYKTEIVGMSNGKTVMYHVPEYDRTNQDCSRFQFFFPASGVFTTLAVLTGSGSTDIIAQLLWPEKNKYIIIDGNDELFIYDFGTTEASPLSGELNIPSAIDENITIHWSPNKIIISYEDGSSNQLYAYTTDGVSWTVDQALPGSSLLPVMPGGMDSFNKQINQWVAVAPSVAVPGNEAIWVSPAGDGVNYTEHSNFAPGTFEPDSPDFQNKFLGRPVESDGTFIFFTGPDDAVADEFDSFQRFNTSLVLQGQSPIPASVPPNAWGWDDTSVHGTVMGVALPEDIILANVRPYITQRPVSIPSKAVPNMPAPFRIRDTGVSAVYDSQRTYSRRTPDGFTIDITVTSFARGGAGNATRQRLEDGHIVTQAVYNRIPNLAPERKNSQIPYGYGSGI
jgi:hypothetical protein